jgi:hypothetical protein
MHYHCAKLQYEISYILSSTKITDLEQEQCRFFIFQKLSNLFFMSLHNKVFRI